MMRAKRLMTSALRSLKCKTTKHIWTEYLEEAKEKHGKRYTYYRGKTKVRYEVNSKLE